MITTIYIGEWRVDQFKDEAATIVSSVLDVSDITKNTNSFSMPFTVPASKRNNILFKHWYDANIDNTFDARVKVDGRIEIDHIPFKIGKFRLTKVGIKKGKPEYYTINFAGNLVSLKETLGKDELSDLDLSAFDHQYDSTTVHTGLLIGLFNRSIIYNLLAKKQYYFNPIPTDNTQSPTLANIAWDGGDDTGIIWNDLRPSIRLIDIIESIEQTYASAENPIVFSRDFFGTSEFTNLYMWLNPDKDKPAGGDTQQVDFDGGDSPYMNLTNNVGSYPVDVAGRKWQLTLLVNPAAGYETVDYEIISIVDGEEYQVDYFEEGNHIQTIDLQPNEPTSFEVSYNVRTTQEFEYTATLVQRYRSSTSILEFYTSTASVQTIESVIKINEELPKLQTINFLKGLFNMFKLVVIPQDDGTLYVDTLNSFYSQGTVREVTKYIDFDSYDVNRGQLLNRIELKYQEPQTILALEFEKNNNRGYGDTEVTLKDDDGKILDGTSLSFTLPFEQVVFERLTNQQTGEKTTVQYGAIIDEEREPVNPKAIIFYNLFVGSGTELAYIEDDNTRSKISSSICTPFHHYGLYTPNYSNLFEAEFSTYTGGKINNTLYSNHYEDYVLSIFNIKRRTWIYKGVLPLHITTNLQLNDTLEIKGNYYRIDKYSYNLLTGETQLTLINNFDESIGVPSGNIDTIFTDWTSKTETIQVTNLQDANLAKIDNGFGTTWATLTTNNNNLSIAFDEFSTTDGNTRSMIISTTGLVETPETFLIYIYQNDKGYIPSFKFNDARNSQNIPLITLRN